MTEEAIFSEIFIDGHGSVQAFVRGEPGTGKSHLIRWLKERFDYASRQAEINPDSQRVVLLTRGNGSLKDALSQMVRQLGATVSHLEVPFEPEAGAYAAGYHAHSAEAKHAGIIHDFATRGHDVR